MRLQHGPILSSHESDCYTMAVAQKPLDLLELNPLAADPCHGAHRWGDAVDLALLSYPGPGTQKLARSHG